MLSETKPDNKESEVTIYCNGYYSLKGYSASALDCIREKKVKKSSPQANTSFICDACQREKQEELERWHESFEE